MDAKKFLFLSSAQRWTITFSLLFLISGSIYGLLFSSSFPTLTNLSEGSLEVLKLLLTASAAWVLILLYASSNSFARIEKETLRFLVNDLSRPSQRYERVHGFQMQELETSAPVSMKRLNVDRTSVTYQISNTDGDCLHMWCNLNVNEFACVFMLPAQHQERYKQIYSATLAGFKRRGLEVTCFGLVPHTFGSESQQNFMELYVLRNLPADFLFDAGARVQLAQTLWGDVRSFMVSAARARTSNRS